MRLLKILSAFVALISVQVVLVHQSNAWMNVATVGGGGVPAAAAACPSGTVVGGDVEGFECSEDGFDRYGSGTAASVITDANSVLSTYSTAQAHGGSHSMSVDIGANQIGYAEIDTGAADGDCSYSFWFYASAVTQWKSVYISAGRATSGDPTAAFSHRLMYGYDATGHYIQIANASGTGSTKIYVATGAWYEIQVDFNDAGTHELSVWDAAGTEDAESPQTVADAGGYNIRYIYLGVYYATADYDAPAVYFDDLKYAAGGGDVNAH